MIRKIVDLVFDNQLVKEIEKVNIDDNVSDIRKNIKFSESQLVKLEEIVNHLNNNNLSLKISKAEVIRRLITLYLVQHNHLILKKIKYNYKCCNQLVILDRNRL